MRRILLDENIPVGLKSLLAAFEVKTAGEMSWAGITNGRLLDAAEAAGFQLMLTADQNIRAQQRLAGRSIAVVVISTNHCDNHQGERGGDWLRLRGGGGGDVHRRPASPAVTTPNIRTRLIAGLSGGYNSY